MRQFARDEEGGALVEFVLAAPLMLILFFGTTEVIAAVHAQQRVAHVAAALGDVVAQTSSVDDHQLSDIFSAASAMMAPLPTEDLGERVASFTGNEAGEARIDWTVSGVAYKGTQALTVPQGYLRPNESVVVVDVSYRYRPSLGVTFHSTLPLQKRVFLTPRLSDKVEKR